MTGGRDEAPCILVVGHVLPHPPAAGNEIRILRMVQWLRRRGFRVVMLFNHEPVPSERRREIEDAIGPVHFVGDDYGSGLDRVRVPRRPFRSAAADVLARVLPDSALYRRWFTSGKPQKIDSNRIKASLAPERLIRATGHLCATYAPSAVIVEYIFAAPCLDAVPPGVLRIIDTHDMFSRKHAEVVAFGVEDPLVCSAREERDYLLKGDVIIAIQPNEARLFRALVPSRDVVTVGIDFDVADDAGAGGTVPGRVLVVGSDNPLNRHGLNAFCESAWPLIRARHPDAVLRVAGKLANHLPIDDERVQRVGWVPDLDDEYRKAAIVINPTQAGTGLKIKSVEALCRGKALVGTPNSVDGIEPAGEAPYVVGADWDAFARAVIDLLGDGDRRGRLERAAARFARETFSAERTYAPLDLALQTARRAARP